MSFQHAQTMDRPKVINFIPVSSPSLFYLIKGKAAACSLGKRCHVLQLSPTMKNQVRKPELVTIDNQIRKDSVLSPIHMCAMEAMSAGHNRHLQAQVLGRTPSLTPSSAKFSKLCSFRPARLFFNDPNVPGCHIGRQRKDPGRPSLLHLAASLTVEAALELPVFFVLVAIILQYASVMRAATQFSGSLAVTAQEMAIAAYKEQYGDANNIIRGVLSDAWATTQVINKAEDKDSVRLASFLASSYLKENDLIKMVLSYQPKPRFSLITLPFTFFVQKAAVRGWTGREGHAGKKGDSEEEKEKSKTVYVTEHGSVYHTNPDCSHLKVTVIPVSKEQRDKARNTSGSKYKKCPYCGNNSTGNYYVNPYGECWHTCVDCPGLKRTVHEVDMDDCGHLHECKDCRKARGG